MKLKQVEGNRFAIYKYACFLTDNQVKIKRENSITHQIPFKGVKYQFIRMQRKG